MNQQAGSSAPSGAFNLAEVSLQSMSMPGVQLSVPGGYWWLLSDHPGGTGLAAAWQLATGRNVRIGVLDSGVNTAHLDLLASHDPGTGNAPPTGPGTGLGGLGLALTDAHGTRVAGLISGAVTNTIAGMGGAPDARLGAVYKDLSGSLQVTQVAALLARQADFDVSNNSWGFTRAFSDNFRSSSLLPIAQALDLAAETGRDGLGTILVVAGGNGRVIRNGQNIGDDANFHNLTNSRHTIAVAATGADGTVAGFSSPGANLLLAAPGVALTTADGLGSGAADAAVVTGTSFAAPLVSATVALMLEVNPGLGSRDVQENLALTARPSHSAGASVNAAKGVNGGGLVFDRDIGFGILDAVGAVRLAKHWQGVATLANEISVQAGLGSVLEADKIFQSIGVQVQAPMQGFRVEWVELGLTLTDSGLRNLAIELVSPSGSRSLIAPNLAALGTGTFLNFTFSTAALRGESVAGQWQVELRHPTAPASFVVYDATLTFHGGPTIAPGTVFITSSFEDLAASDVSRRILSPGDGLTGLLNAASTIARLDLDLARQQGWIGETKVTLDGVFASVIGGAGHDRIIAAKTCSQLAGEEGNDTLSGGAGADTLEGGDGIDTLDYSASTAGVAAWLWNLTTGGGDAQGDVISGFENIIGGAGNDSLNGDNGANVLTGGAGNDFLFAVAGDDLAYGGTGNDTLYGGADNDTLYGGAGNDQVYGGTGADAMYGGDGIDTLRYGDDPGGVTINLATGIGSGSTATGDTFEGFENVAGGAGNDHLTGDALANLLSGGAVTTPSRAVPGPIRWRAAMASTRWITARRRPGLRRGCGT